MKRMMTALVALVGMVVVAKTVVTPPTIPSKPYTGSPQTADVPSSGLYEVTYNEPHTSAGDYEVELQLLDPSGYAWEGTDEDWTVVPFRIRKAQNNWVTEPRIDGWTYGETASVPEAVAKFGTVKVRYDGMTAEGTLVSGATSVTKAGEYEAVFTVVGNANYSGLTNRVPFSVAKASVSGGGGAGGAISVNVNGHEGVYDGQGHSITVEITGNEAATFAVSYALNASGPFSAVKPMFTNVCSETVWYVLSSPNYATVTNSATVTITKRAVTLTSADATKVYDGTPLRGDGAIAVGGEGFVGSEGVAVTYTGVQTEVGSSENTFTYTFNTGTQAVNYEIATVNGTLTVTEAYKPLVMRCEWEDGTVKPDAMDFTILTNGVDWQIVNVTAADDWKKSLEVKAYADGVPVAYTLAAMPAGGNRTEVETFGCKQLGEFLPDENILTESGWQRFGSVASQSRIATVDGWQRLGSTSVNVLTIAEDAMDGVFFKVKVFKIAFEIDDGTGGEGGAASSFSYEGVYDGSGHGIDVSIPNAPSGMTIKYARGVSSVPPEEGWTRANPLFTNVCERVLVWYVVECEGYVSYTNNATVTITKAAYDMSDAHWDYAGTFEYDRTEKTVGVAGLPEGVTVASYSGNVATLPGVYTAHATLAYDEENYNEPTPIEDLVWCIGSGEGDTLEDAFGDLPVIIGPDGDGGWLITLTNDIHLVNGPIEIPDNLGHVTVNMNGCVLEVGDGDDVTSSFAAIMILPAEGDGAPTRISFVTTGGASEVRGGVGASAVVVENGAREGVLVDIGAGVTVRSGGRCPAVVGMVGTLDAMGSLTFPVIPPPPRSYEIETEAVLEQSGAKGTAATNPKNGLVRVGETATLTAKAGNKNTVFAYWLDSEGRIASYTASWKTTPTEDVFYQAVFRLKSKCARPVFDAASDYGADGRASANSMVGVAFNAQMTVNREAYPVKFSAKGLPKGLKINATTGVISGVPTKSGTFTATITVKSAANTKLKASSKKLQIVIAALPTWARGNFRGATRSLDGLATISVGATGKISGKLACGGTNWTFAASSYSSASESTNGVFVAAGTASCKVGKVTVKKAWQVKLNGQDARSPSGATMMEGLVGDLEFEAQRNFWKDKDAAGMLSDWAGTYTWLTPNGEVLTLTLDAKGNVKVVGTVDGGRKLSVSAVAAVTDTAIPYVYVYASPTTVTTKNKKGKVVSKVSYPAFIAMVTLDNAPGIPVAGGDVAYRKQGVRPAVDGASTGTGSFKYSTAYGQAVSNATVTVTAVPAKGSVFVNWMLNGEIAGYGTSYKVKMGDGDFTGLTAVYQKAVTAVDAWAKGTYKGNGLLAGKKAAVTLTLGATGKISGKFTVAKKAYSFAGMAYSQEGSYRATLSVKYGSKVYPLVIAVGQDGETGKAYAEIAVINGADADFARLAK